MRIGIDASCLEGNKTGVGRYLYNLLVNLSKLDKENEYLLFFKSAAYPPELNTYKNLRCVVVKPVLNSGLLWRQFYLGRAAKKEKAEIFHFPFYMMPYGFKLPSVVTIHDVSFEFNKGWFTFWARLAFSYFSRLAARLAKKIITDSEFSKAELIKYYGVSAEKIKVIPLAVDPLFKEAEADESIKEKYKIDADYILYTGSVTKRRNIERLIAAFSKLVKERSRKEKLVLAGALVKPSWNIEELVIKYGVAGRVIHTGYIPDADLAKLYKSAICFVYPSLYEGFGLPVLEAFAAGCPVISSNTSALSEVAGEAALLIDPEKEEELTAALLKLLTDKELCIDLAGKGLQRLRQYSWEETAYETLAIYREVKGEKAVDGYKQLIESLDKKAYHKFFLSGAPEEKERVKRTLARLKVGSQLEKKAADLYPNILLNSSLDLVFLGRMFYLSGDTKYLKRFEEEFDRFTGEYKNDYDILNMLFSYGYFKDAGPENGIKRRFLQLIVKYVKEHQAAPATALEKTVLHAIGLFMPFLYKAPEGAEDLLKTLAGAAGKDGLTGVARPEENLALLETLTVNLVLARLKKKTNTEDIRFLVNSLFDFVFKFSRPDGAYDERFTVSPLNGQAPDLEYIKYLKFLYEEDWRNVSELKGPYIVDYIFSGAPFEPEESDLKPGIFKPDLESAGFPNNKFYIMRNKEARVTTGIFNISFLKDGAEVLANPDKYFMLDDGLIAYDKNLETALWVAGREYDFLDADYEMTPSVRHRIQYFFHKKNSALMIRHKFSGAEEHLVTLKFFTQKDAVNAPLAGYDKQFVRDVINKFTKANKTEQAFLKLNGEETIAASINNGKHTLLPLLNPGLKVEIQNGCVSYTATLLLPNELVFMVY